MFSGQTDRDRPGFIIGQLVAIPCVQIYNLPCRYRDYSHGPSSSRCRRERGCREMTLVSYFQRTLVSYFWRTNTAAVETLVTFRNDHITIYSIQLLLLEMFIRFCKKLLLKRSRENIYTVSHNYLDKSMQSRIRFVCPPVSR